jgi:phosphotransferase system HPr (HPr) family protein
MSERTGERQTEGEKASIQVIVTNRDGLHARPSVAIVNTVSNYQARVTIRKGDRTVDASSTIDLLSLGATQGTELVVTATGPDAVEVLEAIDRLFATEFGVSYSD